MEVWIVHKRLNDCIHETGVIQILQSSSNLWECGIHLCPDFAVQLQLWDSIQWKLFIHFYNVIHWRYSCSPTLIMMETFLSLAVCGLFQISHVLLLPCLLTWPLRFRHRAGEWWSGSGTVPGREYSRDRHCTARDAAKVHPSWVDPRK